jgi:hypothetical protein
MTEEVNILTPKERQKIERREIFERVNRRAEEEIALREEIRTQNLRPACPYCDSDDVHLSVTEGYGWDAETGDYGTIRSPLMATYSAATAKNRFVLVFKPSTETSA